MQRKSSYPVTNCSIKMPDCSPVDMPVCEDDNEQHQRRQHLINFGHSQWGFNNWSWSVTKQELDFVDFANGKYCAGVVAFVSIKLNSLDIYRENIGYATSAANTKGLAIYKSRKCAVTNALRETLLSFGGKVASELLESLETTRIDIPSVNGVGVNTPHVNAPLVGAPLVSAPANVPICNVPVNTITIPDQNENNQNIANRLEPKTSPVAMARKEEPRPVPVPPVARAMPMPATLPRAPPVHPAHPAHTAHPAHPAPAPLRPNSNVSFVLSPVVGGVMPGLYAPRPPVFPEYYEYGPWHFACEPTCPPCPPRAPVYRAPPEEPTTCAPPPTRGCWIKPTIFYDGFWTEQKVRKWVAEQVEKRFPGDFTPKSSSPSGGAQPDVHAPK